MRNFTSNFGPKWAQLWLVAGLCACGSVAESGAEGTNPAGSSCSSHAECASGVCMSGICQGNGLGAPTNSQCTSDDQCASQSCSAAGICNPGSSLADGKSCLTSGECASQQCSQGICGNLQSGVGGAGSAATGAGGNGSVGGSSALGGTTNSGSYVYTGKPPFNGDQNFAPLTPGCGPDTAHSCIPCSHPNGSGTTATVLRAPAFLCFSSDASKGSVDPTPDDPTVIVEQVVETLNGQSYAHVRITFDPAFVDNTYGENGIGWNRNRPHTFESDLTKSDHVEVLLTDAAGNTVMVLGEDYISGLSATSGGPKGKGTGGTTSVSTTPATGCGFGTLGVTGGDGYMTAGSADHVLAAATSLDRNLVGCGYCQSTACSSDGSSGGDCTVNSPKTDALFTANPLTPNWNYNVVYELWIDLAAFGSVGFGQAYMEHVHASPSKASSDTLYVSPSPCPPGLGHCTAGQDCWVNGTGDAGGPPPPDGGGLGSCPQNYQLYTAADGAQVCTPIPFANYDNHDACPTGYILDTASEGRYCLPQG